MLTTANGNVAVTFPGPNLAGVRSEEAKERKRLQLQHACLLDESPYHDSRLVNLLARRDAITRRGLPSRIAIAQRLPS